MLLSASPPCSAVSAGSALPLNHPQLNPPQRSVALAQTSRPIEVLRPKKLAEQPVAAYRTPLGIPMTTSRFWLGSTTETC